MAKDMKIWSIRAQALIAGKIVKDYSFFRGTGSGIEYESFVKQWLDQSVTDCDEAFYCGVLEEFINLMRKKNANS